jgi:lipoyl-dependent peroxiredoxin
MTNKELIMERFASAQWRGNLKQGMGFLKTESGCLSNLPYSFLKRFGNEPGTNPEELIAAAHSGCFAMAMSAELDKKNMRAETIDVKATVTLGGVGEGWGIPKIHLDVSAYVPKAEIKLVEEAARIAKDQCPISKLLKADITMNFTLDSHESASMH